MKYFVILELDGVLGCIDHNKAFLEKPPADCVMPKFSSDADYRPQTRTIFKEYVLSCRPGVREFLTFISRRCHVGIWTRIPRHYTERMVQFLFHGLTRPIEILSAEDCTLIVESWPMSERPCRVPDCHLESTPCHGHPCSNRPNPYATNRTYVRHAPHPGGNLHLKVLHRTVWGTPKFTKKDICLNASNTLLVDSSPQSSLLNPRFNAIFPVVYEGNPKENELRASLAPYLDRLVRSGQSVPRYVKSLASPFNGQEPDLRPSATMFSIKVQVCARHNDRSLLLEDPNYVPSSHSQTGSDYFTRRLRRNPEYGGMS